MKPAWDQLALEYKDSSSTVIGDVDCTSSGQELCEEIGIKGYPTIKYYKAECSSRSCGEDYQGGRDFVALKEFTEENLVVKCTLENVEGCSDKEKDFMGKWKDKTPEEVKAQLERLNGMSGSAMKPELKQWLTQRLNILKQL